MLYHFYPLHARRNDPFYDLSKDYSNHRTMHVESNQYLQPATKVESSDPSSSYFYTSAGAPIADEEQFGAEYKQSLKDPILACRAVAGQVHVGRQRTSHGQTSANPPNSRRLKSKNTAHPDGHCVEFPPPPKAWECCGCKQKYYNFEKLCSFCATLYCKDCKKIPWK